MAYCYRFIDGKGDIIYIGKTVNIDRRMADHFAKGHLPKECYKSVARIDYQKFNTESDALVYETYYITKYAPRYNKLQQSRDIPTMKLEEKNWKVYKEFKPVAPPKIRNTGIWRFVAIIYLLYMLYYYLIR